MPNKLIIEILDLEAGMMDMCLWTFGLTEEEGLRYRAVS
jgi:hypothetical protein